MHAERGGKFLQSSWRRGRVVLEVGDGPLQRRREGFFDGVDPGDNAGSRRILGLPLLEELFLPRREALRAGVARRRTGSLPLALATAVLASFNR